ncbi:MAG: PEGA domain-containing protein [Alistipes sp.]|nr:PEGA domain-containing protein [Alistipes sp.]
MKRLITALLSVVVWLGASAQSAKNTLEIDASSFAPVQTDVLSGVAIDKIAPDLSRRPCARIKMHINRMTREEIEGLSVKPIGGNVIVMRRDVASEGNGLIIELTAKSPTRFYLHHDTFGDSNEVSLDLEGDKEYRLEARLDILLPIVVRSNTKGASVYLDDVYRGTIGENYDLVVQDVVPGNHTLRLEQGAARAEQQVDVSRENISFRIAVNTATSRPQYVVFELEPKTAVLFIDDKPCTTREGFAQTVLQNGTYSYRVMAGGYHESSGTFTVSGAKVERKVSLKADAAMVTLSAGEGVEIWVNNELKGLSPWRGMLASGTYIFEARKAGHRTTTLSQAVTSATAEQSYSLPTPQPIVGSADISSVPAMADIYIDGKNMGRTPLLCDLLVGEHNVELRREGYTPKTEKITVREGVTASLKIELRSAKTLSATSVGGAPGTYKVGDLYDDGKKQGVVFEVSEDGRHGKIVSLTQSENRIPWTSDEDEQKRLIGADDEYHGANNMAKVEQIPNWQSKYPAFAWCATLGEGWYLPAREELLAIYRSIEKLNAALANNGAEIASFYWSSTEYNKYNNKRSGEFYALYLSVDGGLAGIYDKSRGYYVRAVSAF